jgi:vacuolar-type H+-ATPase subunit I/STV1
VSENATEVTPGTPKGTNRFFTQEEVNEMMNNARTQERNKLYPTIESTDARAKAMADEVAELKKSQKVLEKAEADRAKALTDAQKAREEAELSAKDFAERVRQENAEKIAALQAQQDSERALLRRELEFMQLQNHTQRRVAEEADSIAPELIDFISGDTVEEVEKSIEVVKAKTAQIVENMRNAATRARTGMPGVAPSSGVTGVTPLDQMGNRVLTAEEIKGMPMAEFAQLRKKIGMPSGSGRGLFD